MNEENAAGREGSAGHTTTSNSNSKSKRPGRQGLESAIDNADPWWWSTAWSALATEAKTGREFDAFDLTDRYGVDGPDSPARWGALFRSAHTQGLIVPVGFRASRRPSRAGGVCRVWTGASR